MEAEFGWSRSALTGAFSLSLLVMGICAYPVGSWVDRKGGRWLMTAGSAMAALLVFAWSQTQTLWQFYLVWVGIGLCAAMVLYDAAFIIVAQWFSMRRGTALAIITFSAGFASTIFLPWSDWLLRQYGWRDAVAYLALLLVIVTVPLHAMVLRSRPEQLGLQPDGVELPDSATPKPRFGIDVRGAISGRTFWLLTLAFGFLALSASAIRVHFIPFLIDVGISPTAAAWAAGAIGITQVVGRVLFAGIEHRITRAALLIGVFAVQAAAMAVLLAGQSLTLIWGFILGFGAAQGMATLVRPAILTELYGISHFGRISAIMSFFLVLCQTTAPFAASVAYDLRGDYQMVLWMVTILAVLATVAAIMAWRGILAHKRQARVSSTSAMLPEESLKGSDP
jgi:MFS family permease